MGKTFSQSWVRDFDSPPERIWPLLSDTARFNEAIGLPKHEIEERPQPDGSVRYFGRARKGPVALAWEERPVNWVANRWFEHWRGFSAGPLAHLCARFALEPTQSGCQGTYSVEASAGTLVGEGLLRTGFFPAIARDFETQATAAAAFARGERESAFDYQPPEPPPGARERLAERAERIERSGHGHGMAERLAELLLSAQEVDLTRLRPLALARRWRVPGREVVELCLEATRQGLLSLRWDLLCPRCRVAKAVVGSLDKLPSGAHCGTCNIDYDRNFSQNVELSFQPVPAIRPVEMGEYCLFGPMSTPHIHLHLTLEPGEARAEPVALAPGRYRLRTLEPGPEREVDWAGGGFPEVVAEDSAEGAAEPGALRAGDPAEPGQVRLRNATDRRLTLIVEECRWVRDALTADRVGTSQAFRDLFSDQVLRPGDEVSIARVTLLFSDLAGSTALYGRIGDARAYHLVRDHFAVLAALVREHDGAIVKTIGDAVMAAFADPAQGVRAALAVEGAVADFNRRYPETPIAIKLGLHEGPSIAVTLNERLDYFGSTVNLAARLQGQSRGGDIVLSAGLARDPAVAPLIAGLAQERDEARLKGFADPVPFLRLLPRAGEGSGAGPGAGPEASPIDGLP